jgi:ubiquinone biosynthesis protein UbiJ
MNDGDATEPRLPAVELHDPPRANLISLLVRAMLDDRLAHPKARTRAARLRGAVLLRASDMSTMLRFQPGRITVGEPRENAKVTASIRGDMSSLLHLTAGQLPIRELLAGKLTIFGDPIMLLRLLMILRREPKGDERRI